MNQASILLSIVFLLLLPVHAETVSIHRDQYGVPHIFADTEEGVSFGAGYAQAEDRLEQILRHYLMAEGKMAEVFGGRENFQSDYVARVFRHAAISRDQYETLNAKTRSCIEAFQEGIRAFMREHPGKVPSWAPELRPWQVVALGRIVIWGWLLDEVYGDLRRGNIKIDEPSYRGSNQWLIARERTSLNASLALIDPHLSWYGPFRFYECRLYGGELEFSGMVIAGTPFLGLGHNRYLSISMTTGGPDTSDVYEVEVNAENPRKYRYGDDWREMSVRSETIGIKEKTAIRSVEVEIESTHHGPILARKGTKAYAAATPYLQEVKLLDQSYRMITSRNLQEMKQALAMFQVMPQNIMVATVEDDLYYLRNGRVPIRPEGFDFSRPVPGNSSAAEWRGIHPLSDLIQITNPSQGYMQNCNVAPAFMMKNGSISKVRYENRSYLYNEEENLHQRAAMVLELLDRKHRVSVNDATEIALSTDVYKAERWQDLLRSSGVPSEPDSKRFYDLIVNWDRRSDFDSTGAVAYRYWKGALGRRIARLVDPAQAATERIEPRDLHAALQKGLRRLRDHFGNLEVLYGQIYRVGRVGSEADYPVGGGSLREWAMATPRAVRFEQRANHTYVGRGGQCAVQLVILTSPPHSYTVVPLGQSDDPRSDHWDDQARELFSRRKMKPTYFLDEEELMQHVRETRTLKMD